MTPGPGDEITWGACVGHPGDPRSEDFDDDEFALTEDELQSMKDDWFADQAYFDSLD